MPDASNVPLRRSMGVIALTAYGVGDILGAGIYALLGEVAARAGSLTWLSFAATFVVAALTALSYAELTSRFPESGGEAQYCRYGLQSSAVAVFAGYLVLASGVASLATVSTAFAEHLVTRLPPAEQFAWLLAVGYLAAVGGVAFWGIRQSSRANIVCTIVEVSGLLLVIGVGAVFILSGRAANNAEVPIVDGGRADASVLLGVAQGSALAFFAFIGFEDMANVAEEVRRPKRTLPFAIISAVAITAVIYVLVTWVATQVVPPEVLGRSKAPLVDVVHRAAPVIPSGLFLLVALFAIANTGLLNCVTGSRLLYGMGRRGLLPAWLAAVHQRLRTPHRAIAVVLGLAIALALSGSLSTLAGATNLILLAVFALANLSLVAIKWRERGSQPANDVFRIPAIVPVAGLGTSLAMLAFAPVRAWGVFAVVAAAGMLLAVMRIVLAKRAAAARPAD